MKRHYGFSLIELLVVISILSILSGMLMPVVVLARKRAASTNTLALMRKVETGLELFKGELGTYPYQVHDPSAIFPEAGNRLAWVLAHDLTQDERNALDADLAVVREAYRQGGDHYIVETELDPRVREGLRSNDFMIHSTLASRGARERGILAIVAGNVAVNGVGADSTIQLVPSPASRGMAYDYLSLDLNPSDIRGDALVDAWGQPLIYNCPVIQGLLPVFPNTSHMNGNQNETPIDPRYYGFHTIGREVTTSLASDQRTTAAAAYVDTFELWSIGPDGLVAPERGHPTNRDNLSPTRYWKDLE